MRSDYRRNRRGTVLLASLVFAGVPLGRAATAADAPTEALQQIVVTGSLIPTTPDSAVVPVTTLDAAALQRTGITTNALDLLRKAVPAFEGRSNAGSSNAQNHNQFTAGRECLRIAMRIDRIGRSAHTRLP